MTDVFNKFKGSDGKLKEELRSNIKGIMSLYEAAHLRIHGEETLEEALVFTTHHPKEMVEHAATNKLSAHLIKQAVHALEQPLHTGIPRVETRHFISFYEKDEDRDEILLRFAKIDYSMVQILHQQELSHFCKWDISAIDKLPADFLKLVFRFVINVYDEIEKEMSKDGRPHAASYTKERVCFSTPIFS
ncbi:hypothetical protein Ancab_034104 [Ancistrocladus abbreviatus]